MSQRRRKGIQGIFWPVDVWISDATRCAGGEGRNCRRSREVELRSTEEGRRRREVIDTGIGIRISLARSRDMVAIGRGPSLGVEGKLTYNLT